MSVKIHIKPCEFKYTYCNALIPFLDNDIHVYEILLSENKKLVNDTTLLSNDEMLRANKYFKQADKERFIISRIALRNIFCKYLDVPNCELIFTKDKYGKPHLINNLERGIQFSISHAGNIILIAFSSNKIGIDVEVNNPLINYGAIIQETFTETEKHFIKKNDDSVAAFLNIWTKKEALLKAIGVGIVNNLSELCTLQHLSTYVLKDYKIESDCFLLSQMPMSNEYYAAIASSSIANNIYRFKYTLLFS